jgi:hypothetical protein
VSGAQGTGHPAACRAGVLESCASLFPHQDVLCTPVHRLLLDSQDIPVTVTPLRADRVLLFDDALVLLQVEWG